MTAPRMIVEGATYGLTLRCTLRKAFLTPLVPLLHLGIAYLLAAAAEPTGVIVHNVVVMPNHIHLVVTTTRPNLPEFKRRFFGEVSKFVKVALAELGFEPPETVFSEAGRHQWRLINPAAQLSYLHYQDVNTISAGLVEKVEQYPGLSTEPGLMNGGVMALPRPPIYLDRRFHPTERVLPFASPPVLTAAYGSAREVVYQLDKLRGLKENALAAKRERPVLGALGVTQVHPWSEPRSPRRFRRGPKKSYLVVGDDALDRRCALEQREGCQRYRESRLARLAGKEAVFPYGTYQLRVQHGVQVEPVEATEGRVVNAPGALVDVERMSRDAKRALNAALRAEASTVTQEELDDSLVARLEAAKEDEVDRREAPRVTAGELRTDADAEEGAPPKRQRPKLVVLRGSTETAWRRRRRKQKARRRVHDDALEPDGEDPSDVEPPFD